MFSKQFTLTFGSSIKATDDALFEFHSDTHNLSKITPPWIGVSIVDLTLPLKENSVVTLDIKQFGLTTRWVMQIDKLERPHRVCDKAIKSPFKYFYHEHAFHKIDEKHTFLKDTINFELPLYPLSLIALPLIKKDMKRMFAYRHEQTKKLLEIN